MTTLLDRLAELFPAARRTTLRRMIAAGRVTVNGAPARIAKQPLDENDAIIVADQAPVASKRSGIPRPWARLDILHEDEDILVVNKPAGLLTSTVPREPRPTLLAMVRGHYADDRWTRVGLIHRLDRDASGLLVFSRNMCAYESLKTQFFKHTVERVYTAIVHGVPKPPAGRIETRLVEVIDGSVHSTRLRGKGQVAVTDYELVSESNGRSCLKVMLQTGRKHQIRVHLSEKGWPIAGDPIYGRDDDAPRLMLAATRLVIDHPRTGRRQVFEIHPPKEFT